LPEGYFVPSMDRLQVCNGYTGPLGAAGTRLHI
jgi:hypothetical protein